MRLLRKKYSYSTSSACLPLTCAARAKTLKRLQLSVPGEHNIANALAATACCHTLGVDLESIASTLESFTGTQRRFDVIGTTKNGLCIVDDYAHHPTEIRATLKAAGKCSSQ